MRNKTLASIAVLIAGFCSCSWAQRQVQDELGRTMTIPEKPHRVVCLTPSVTDTVYTLGAGDEVVGVSDYTKYPAEALKKPSVGQVLNPSIEAVVALHPDLAIGVGDLNTEVAVLKIERLGIPVFLVVPHGIGGIYRSIENIGKVLNREREARELVSSLRAREEAVRKRVSGKPPVRVFMPLSDDPVITIGKNAFLTELITAAGGRSVTDDLAQDWPNINMEAVLVRQPDYLLLIEGSPLTIGDLRKRPGWKNLVCVQQNRIFYVDDRMNYSSPLVFGALESLAKQFHP
ncbi:MAG TPA: cobalamin-binding protein [Candidatus Angelobacter sp.]|jgi:iron complex transport system substrate-binding protein|nr:cobalamin-binding protein [Candidatus Angelobacter sp.]